MNTIQANTIQANSVRKVKKVTNSRANETDKLIANKIRMLRIMRGVPQRVLAEYLNVTIQQVQKYEKGNNRVSGSTILTIANALEVPVTCFFKDLKVSETSIECDEKCVKAAYGLMRIKNEHNRRIVCDLIRSLAKEEAA